MRENDRDGRWCGFGEVGMGVLMGGVMLEVWEMVQVVMECNERGCGKGGCDKVGWFRLREQIADE